MLALPSYAAHAATEATDEIIVTAQKRAQRLNDVGLTINVVGQTALNEAGISAIGDLPKLVPGFNVQKTRLGYAVFDGRFFSLTPRILRLGYAYLSSASIPARLQPFLENISEETGESSSAAMLDGDEIVYIARSATRRIMSIGLGVGSRLPAYCTSLGRALLAYQPEAEIEAYLDRVSLAPRTRFTITEAEKLRAVLLAVREQGYAAIDEELELGLRSIAVPVRPENGSVKIAINIGTQAVRYQTAEMVERFLPVLKAASQAIRYAL